MTIVWFYLALILAIGFYWVRLNHRLCYGAIEILVALAGMLVATFPADTHALAIEEARPWGILAGGIGRIITEIGAIYIFVRGLDNIHEALKPPTWREAWDEGWDRIKQAATRRARRAPPDPPDLS
jgi:hypothetical protein